MSPLLLLSLRCSRHRAWGNVRKLCSHSAESLALRRNSSWKRGLISLRGASCSALGAAARGPQRQKKGSLQGFRLAATRSSSACGLRVQVSMLDGALFDALEALARGIRGKQGPFGGIQLILAGQFHSR